MNVLVTLLFLAIVAAYAVAVFRRLLSLREQVKLAWKKLEADQSNHAVKAVYNKHVRAYNDALEVFPGNMVGLLAGLKPARVF